ncbi:geranylgeranylglycerol-phosphate geranylgeranyltransferase [Nonlabens sp. YIK11]|uniref:geranylgeranylglycerol-phosphate geranylgeranyltransferase n=1 Tax=Nonlabens sp. YIK11 TaxID=1453349 RepID=UPI001E615172|nr:geranylgeranylglycerol-phosphate geranylgeranyltransferase [Nonlabens sp. YIK11]
MIYLKLTRWPNVLMTVLTQLVIIYGYLPQTQASLALESWQVFLLLLATALLTASGNVINDIYDVATDVLNKPDKVIVGKRITEKKAFNFYILLTILAVVAGFILANSIHLPSLAAIFIIVSFVLYLYATNLKKILLLGNVVISVLVALVVIIIAVFELVPSITDLNRAIQLSVFRHLLIFSLFAFLVNLLRENIKDCQDVKGDHATGRNSLAIVLGRLRALKVLSIYTIILVLVIGYLVFDQLFADRVTLYYIVFLIMAPLMFLGIRLWTAVSKKELAILSLVCKLVLLTGIIGIALIKF